MKGFAELLRRVGTPVIAGALLTAAGAAGAPAASARTVTLGGNGWRVQSSATAGTDGARISRPGFDARSWNAVGNDGGGAPGTEIEALVQNGACPHVFVGENLTRCFGTEPAIGPVKVARFAVPWWWRTTFTAPAHARTASLIVNGVDGAAAVFLDGHRIAGQGTVQGAFTRYRFDVAGRLAPGRNAVAVEVFPNDPQTMFTLDNVDWTQIPPDNNTGIQFPVALHTAGVVSLTDAHVVQHDSRDLSRAALTVKGLVANSGARARAAHVRAVIRGPGHAAPIAVHATVTVPGHGRRAVVLTPAHHPALVVHHPAVWWPYQMGAQPLYGLRMNARAGRGPADADAETFGIRTLTSRRIGASRLVPHGSRQYVVNGVPFEFRGGGWSEDLLLHYSTADTAHQIALIKNLGLNGIRTEGHVMPERFYEQMDRAGILVDAGFQCCDAWQLQDSELTSGHDLRLLGLSARTIGENLRDHPSVLGFQWSDDQPTPAQARVSIRAFRAADFDDPLVASAEDRSTPGLGAAGEKEGPYDWVPPGYWYDTTHFDPGDSTRTNAGGAWGFDSESSAGATIPTLDSLRRFESPAQLSALWRKPNFNQFHLNYETGLPSDDNDGYAFGTLHDLDAAMRARYGPWSSLRQFVQEGQLQNYETQRAQFEAYLAHSRSARSPSTGIVYWQLNKGWPSLLWTLYNHDYDQAGSYFGAQEANRTLHAFYDYGTGGVDVANLGAATASDLSVTANVYSVSGRLLSSARSQALSLGSQGVAGDVLTPKVPSATAPPAPAQTYFVQLQLTDGTTLADESTYWLSTQADRVDWDKTIGHPQATMSSFANLEGLRALAPAKVGVTAHSAPARGSGDRIATVTITNRSPGVAFFLHADVRRGSVSGRPAAGDDQVGDLDLQASHGDLQVGDLDLQASHRDLELAPVFWDRNDTTLFPGQSETLHVRYSAAQLNGAAPVVTVSGDNVARVAVRAR